MERQALTATCALLKDGRVLSAENEDRLKQAEELIHQAQTGNDRGLLTQAERLLEEVLSQVDAAYRDPEKGGVSPEVKSFRLAELKALPGEEPGTFEALVAVYGNVDSVGDRVEQGAFGRTLKERGLPPIVWSHAWDVPPIGTTSQATETDEGLLIKGRLFVGDGEDSPVARQVYTAMKAKDGNGQSPLREFSFGYSTKDSTSEQKDGEDIRVLTDLDLFEVGPTLVGANPATRLVGIKSQLAREAELFGLQAPRSTGRDKPQPKPQGGEEAEAKIADLLTARPWHHKETTHV